MNQRLKLPLFSNLIHVLVLLTLGSVCWIFIGSLLTVKMLGLNISEASPTAIFQYWYYYGDNVLVINTIYRAGAIAALIVLTGIGGGFIFKKMNNNRSLHGDAKFATANDIKNARLYANRGVILGKKGNKFLILDGQEHVFLDAPSRSGKGVGIVIPNLLNWPESVVVIDIKRENWDITAGFRSQHGQECILFDPLSPDFKTHRWNPLSYVNKEIDAFAIDDIMRIGSMIWSETAGNQGFFEGLARNLFIGFASMIRVTDSLPFTLGESLRQSMKPNLSEYLQDLIAEREENGLPLPPQAVEAFNAFCGTSPNVQGSILATYQQKLELFTNPLIDAATSANDFDLRDIRKKKMSIYLATTPDNLERVGPLINIFLQQLVNLNTQELPEHNPELKYQCLLVNDEFTALGKIPILAKSVAYVAGYGLRLLTIVQSPAQLRAVYGADQAENYQVNHPARVVFATKENAAAREISETLGNTTVNSKSKSTNRSGLSLNSSWKTGSDSESPHGRALLLPQEIKDLGKDKEIILIDGFPPIMANKVFYYKDKVFSKRKNLPTPYIPKIDFIDRANRHTEPKIKNHTNTEPRAIESSEVASLDKMLEDFSSDFSSIEVPKSNASDQEKQDLVNQLFDIMDSAN